MVIAYHLLWTVYGFWLPNDPRGSTSHAIASDVIAHVLSGAASVGRFSSIPHLTFGGQFGILEAIRLSGGCPSRSGPLLSRMMVGRSTGGTVRIHPTQDSYDTMRNSRLRLCSRAFVRHCKPASG